MSYLVETYRSGADGSQPSAGVEAAIAAAIAAMRLGGAEIEFVASMNIPGDETTFYLFEATSMETVREAIERAGIVAERVVEALASELKGGWPAGAGGRGGQE